MLRVFAALTVAAAAAVAAQDCGVDDSSPSCAAQTQKQLLQASKLQRTEVLAHSDVSSSVAPMLEMVQGFAQLVGQEGRNLTSTQKELVRTLNATFYNQTLPTITKRHANDINLLLTHVAAIQQCNTDLANNSLRAASMKSIYDQASSASTTCADEESAALNASTSANAAMTFFLKDSAPGGRDPPPNSTMPAIKGPTLEMDKWVRDHLDFYTNFNRTYYGLKATMTATKAAHSTKAGECKTKATAASGKYCTWFDEVTLFKSEYESCRSTAIMLYSKTLAAAISNMNGRKSDYTALMKIECLLRVLLAEDGTSQSKLKACETAAAPDLRALDIVKPVVPDRAESVLAGLGSPVDKSCHLYRDDDDSTYGA